MIKRKAICSKCNKPCAITMEENKEERLSNCCKAKTFWQEKL